MSSLSLLLLGLLSLLSFSLVSSQVSSGYCFSYTFTGGSTAATQWTVTASGLLATSSALSSTLRNSATITAITGSRTFSNASFTSTVSFTGIVTGTNATNAVFSQFPYTDTTGWSITTSGPVYYQGAVGTSSILLWQSYDPLLETSGAQEIYVGQLKVTTNAAVSSVSSCPNNITLPVYSLQQYSFCWYIQSDGSDSVSAAGFPWTTYAYGVVTGSQSFEQEGRQAIELNSITGIRYITINGSTWWNRLTGVKNDITDLSQWGIKNDNILYLSDPYLDQYGWLVTADSNLTYPLGLSASPDINFEFDQFGTLEYIDLNADNVNYMMSTNQGFSYAAYTAGGAHAVCKSNNNTATAFTPATTQWTFCYVIYGADSINGAWQITSSGTITTYAQIVNVSSVVDGSPVSRSGYVAIGITGTRVWSNSSLTITRNILGLVPNSQLSVANKTFNNVVYTSYPYVDAGGLTFYLDGPVVPYSVDPSGRALNNVTFINIESSGYDPLFEYPTGGAEGSLIIRPASTSASLPSQCASLAAGTSSQYSFCYYISGDKSANDPAPQATWSISGWGIATVSGPFEREGQANTYRITAVTGQRLLTVTSSAGVTSNYTQNILGIRAANADLVSYGFFSNNVLYIDGFAAVGSIPASSTMHTDQYGLIFTLDSNALFPTNTGTVQASGPDINLCTDQFGTDQYYEESVNTASLIAQSANSGMSLNPYSSGAAALSCPNTPATYTPAPAGSSGSGYCFSYTFTGGNTAATQWTVTAQGVLSTATPLSNVLRNQATITGITGTRTFSNASFTSTVSFTGIITGTAASNTVFSQFPYTDTTGWSITTSGPVYYQGAVGTSSILLWQSYDPLLETSGAQEIYVGQLKVTTNAAVSSVSSCPNNITLPVYSLQQYSFCWYIQSDGSDSVSAAGFPWTTYAYGVVTGSQSFEQEGRQAIELNSITGIRYITINGSTWWNRLTGVKNDITDLSQWGIKNDNILYLSDPYLDQYGWLVTADSNLTYPLGLSASPDINFEFDQFGTLEYIDLNADNVNYMMSTNQGFSYSAYTVGGAHAVCQSKNNTATALTPATTQWTFCYSIYGADPTNGNWLIQASGTITTYAQAINTTNANDEFPASRPGYVVIGVSGTRTWSNSSFTSTRNILGVVPDTTIFSATYPADNIIYTSYPYVDAGGLTFYLDGPVYPQQVDQWGQLLNNATFVNIHANGVNPLKELPTGGEAGALIIRPAATSASLPSQCSSLVAGSNTQYSFCYYITGDKSSGDPAPNANWTVSSWGVITVSGPFEREGVANTYRVTSMQGQRSVTVTTLAGVTTTTTQNIAGIKGANGDINQYNFATNNILYPSGIPNVGAIPGGQIVVDLYGWLIALDSNVVYPANNGTITSVGTDLDFATDQFGTNQYQDVSLADATSIFLQSSKSGASVQPYTSGSVSFTCPNTPASYTPSSSSSGGSGLSGGAIAGIVVGSVIGALILLVVAAALLLGGRSRSNKSDSKQLGGRSTDASEASQVQHSQVELQGRTDEESQA